MVEIVPNSTHFKPTVKIRSCDATINFLKHWIWTGCIRGPPGSILSLQNKLVHCITKKLRLNGVGVSYTQQSPP